jgi:hypothetical protein
VPLIFPPTVLIADGSGSAILGFVNSIGLLYNRNIPLPLMSVKGFTFLITADVYVNVSFVFFISVEEFSFTLITDFKTIEPPGNEISVDVIKLNDKLDADKVEPDKSSNLFVRFSTGLSAV